MRSLPPALLVVLTLLSAALVPATATAAEIVVGSAADAPDARAGDGDCETADGVCTLRAAIQTANEDVASDRLVMATPPGVAIRPATALPVIRTAMEIHGALANGRPGIELDGSLLAPDLTAPPQSGFSVRPPHGLFVRDTAGVTIRGLVIHSFPGAQVQLLRAAEAHLKGNWLGLDAEGVSDRGREIPGSVDSAGIVATAVTQSSIGGLLPGERNVVSGLERGVIVDGASSFTSVEDNWIGLSATGGTPVGNDDDGIAVGPQADRPDRPSRVTIAGNTVAATGHGSKQSGIGGAIRVNADDTVVRRNWVGFDGAHETVSSWATTFGNRAEGILVADAVRTDVSGNHLAAGGASAIAAIGADLDGLVVRGNVAGLDATGREAVDELGNDTGNDGPGVLVLGGRDVIVGGFDEADGNLLANNRYGVLLGGALRGAQVRRNTIGTDATGTRRFQDDVHGISVEPDEGAAPDAVRISDNRIGGERGHAIVLFAGRDHVVRGNTAGVGPTGTVLPGAYGISVIGAAGAVVGGAAEGEGNTVVGQGGAAVAVIGRGSTGARVEGNRLGFDADGGSRGEYRNGTGVMVEEHPDVGAPSGTRVGGEVDGAGNEIGNSGTGVRVDGAVRGTVVLRNSIGVNEAGVPGANGSGVVVRDASGTAVGAPGHGNTIASSHQDGVRVSGLAVDRLVQANRIGVVVAGGVELPNGRNGVRIENATGGVVVGAPRSRTLTADCSSDECNRFGPSGGAAVAVLGRGAGAVVRGNTFGDPDALPIDLGADGPSPLEARDARGGDQGRLNQPTGVQESYDPRGRRWFVTGVIEAATPELLTVDLYGISDSGAVGSGGRLLGTVRPDRRGLFALEVAEADRALRYTALTQGTEGTSEFARGCGARVPALAGDADRDGVCDEWERHGVDYDQDGSGRELTLPGSVGARDLYVELDAMEQAPGLRDPRPGKGVMTELSRSFAAAPGGGVRLHWMGSGPGRAFDERVPSQPVVDGLGHGPGTADDLPDYRYGLRAKACDGWFGRVGDRAAADCFARLGARGLAVRYVLAAQSLVRDRNRPGAITGGAGPDNRMAVLGLPAIPDAAVRNVGAGHRWCGSLGGCDAAMTVYVLMHELGHTLGLRHNGVSDGSPYNPAHLSVMSYTYSSASDGNPLDYARTDGLRIDEGAIDERSPVELSETDRANGWRPSLTRFVRLTRPPSMCMAVFVPSRTGFDLDDDGAISASIAHGVNDPAGESCFQPAADRRDVMSGYEEWSKLQLSTQIGRDFIGDGNPFAPDPPPAGGDVIDPAAAGAADLDGDGVPAGRDVCPLRADADQEDANGDGIGDACVADYVPSDLELTLDAPRRIEAGSEADVVVRVRQAWPLATGGATVAVELPAGLELVGHDGDGVWDPATGRWATGGFAPQEQRTLRLRVRATTSAVEARFAAEVVEAAAEDADSVPGNGDPEEDDLAERTVELVAAGPERLLSAADAHEPEGTRTVRDLWFEVDLNGQARAAVTFRARTSDGTARAGEDYEPVDRVVTIPRNADGGSVRVPIVVDSRDEDDETVMLTLSEVEGAAVGRLTATGTIADDDAPLGEGELAPFGCVAKPDRDDLCDIESGGATYGSTSFALAAGRDLYVTDGVSIGHLRRDAETEALTPTACWRVRTRQHHGETSTSAPGCADLQKVVGGSSTEFPFLDAGVSQLAAAPNGRHLYAVMRGSGHVGLAAFAIDQQSGALTLRRCVGWSALGPACSGASGLEPAETSWDVSSISPDGRHLYVAVEDDLRLVRIGGDGLPDAFRCADSGAPSNGGDCAPLLAHQRIPTTAMAPDGATLAFGGGHQPLTTFRRDPATGLLGDRRTNPFEAEAFTWSPDGSQLYASGFGAIVQFDTATLERRGCVEDQYGPEVGCATVVPVSLDTGAMAVAPDGRDLYAATGDGGVVSLRRAADGSLGAARCNAPATDAGRCGNPDAQGGTLAVQPEIALYGDGRMVLATGGGAVSRFVRVQPPAPGGNRAPLCADAAVATRPGESRRVRLDCADPDGDPVTVQIVTSPVTGALTGLDPAAGLVDYVPQAGFRGSDQFAFRGGDGSAESADARVTVTVEDPPPPPPPPRRPQDDGGRDGGSTRRGGGSTTRRGGSSRRGGGSSRRGSGSCRSPCRPDDNGDVTIVILCNGRRDATGSVCEGTIVVVLCDRSGCRPSRGARPIAGGASARGGKLLPGVPGLRLGETRVKVAPGRRMPARVRLTKAARRLLARRGRVTALVVVRVRQPDGRTATTRRVVTIEAPAKRGRGRTGGTLGR
ncbi:Calx-beta domain-containing protein [Conexibacter woesei]|uniref:Na-Ca exchanger/integrin-beta4 n=1 Tax=Conexibacter woesei (strain DSM 14684 / CCUG 47730 / CIP 108061 / JCM 11494 / NBRC 100937 / ID131577) TaxID=469383 RepID=D3F9B0_CONWI|nr:Calx-beta domain-containing protein [Conexibacter woesei]ADB49077.1 Na-Ca exchanger/integrin-beta4 [Conexibacter woesei DSM 14684]